MTHRSTIVVCSTLALLAVYRGRVVETQALPQGARPLEYVNGLPVAAGEVLVRFRSNAATPQSMVRDADADAEHPIGQRGWRRLHSASRSVQTLLATFKARPDVAEVEPNYLMHTTAVPNDPLFSSQWDLSNSSHPGADIHAVAAWNVTTGTTANVVGVVDTGVDYTHPDIAANMWSAPAAFTVTLNGQPITCPAGSHGFNAITLSCDPADDAGHGTHTAGTIGAVGNNGVGVAGVNWTTQIMALKFLDSTGSGFVSDAINAIDFALQAKTIFASTAGANVRVLSNSWGGTGTSTLLEQEIAAAGTADVLFVAAAGNSASNNDAAPFYPASYPDTNVIAVAATDGNDALASFSNYGPTSVDLGAPGVNILSTIPGNNYTTMSGTSMATPHVSGAAMLVLSVCALNTAALRSAILNSVDVLPSLTGVVATNGRLNAANAVTTCSPHVTPPSITLTSPTAGSSYQAPATIALSAQVVKGTNAIRRVEFYQGQTLIGTMTTSPYVATWSNVGAGTYTLTAKVYDSGGATAVSAPVQVTVTAVGGLPSPWAAQDIGSVGVAGSATGTGTAFTVSGSGADIWGAADAFQFVYQPLVGDGQIVAHVATLQNTDPWAKAGVMIRQDLTPGASHAALLTTPANGVAFERRATSGAATVYTAGAAAPWLKLVRTGSTITASSSLDGATWTVLGSDTITLSGTVYVGLAVTSHQSGTLATATFDNVSTNGAPAGPTITLTSPTAGAPFTAPATVPLAATATDPSSTITKVEFYQGQTLITTTTTSPYVATWSNVAAGPYTLTAKVYDAANATAVSAPVQITVTPAGGGLPSPWAAQDIGSVGVAGSATGTGTAFTVSGSGADIWGTADAFQFVYQPLVGDGQIVAHVATLQNVNPWAKAGVMIRQDLTPSASHAALLTTPANGVAFERRTTSGAATVYTGGAATQWIKLVRTGTSITASTSLDGATWTVLGSDTIALSGTVYVGLAVTSHQSGTLATATFDNISTNGAPAGPTITLTSPTAGAPFTAPATVPLAATATDPSSTITKVEFYQGQTLITTTTTSPYVATWSNVAAGTYTLTAKVYDAANATAVSAPIQITVTPAGGGLPSPWAAQDIGSVGVAGSATGTGTAFTVSGSGADIWGAADAFQFVYQPLVGDGQIVAHVATLQNTDPWAKAGVMIRQDLTPGASHAALLTTPANGVAFERRTTAGNSTVYTAGAAAPWLKLVRTGSTITASSSLDGVTWTVLGSDTITLSGTVYVGLAVTSHQSGTLATATFDNVSQ